MKMNFRTTLLSIATLGLFSCSDKVDDVTQLPSDGITDGFVTFSVSAVGNELRTARAGGNPDNGDFDYGYEGAANEYKVSTTTGANVVYFFDTNNKFISLSNLQIMNGDGSDVSHDDDHSTANDNTLYKEKLLKARIIKEADASIATGIIILNGDPNTLSSFDLKSNVSTLSDFMKLSQTLTLAQGKSGNMLGRYDSFFTMSNTVYLDNENKVQGPVNMKNKIKTTMEDAEKDPIQVHVERVAAKFSVTFNETGKETSILTDKVLKYTDNLDKNGISVKSEYNGSATPSAWGVLVNGWDVNGTETKTYWVKNLYDGSNFTTTENSTQYYTGVMSPTAFGKWAATTEASAAEYGWNDNNRLRSYWAVDPHYNAADGSGTANYPQQYRPAKDNDDDDFVYGSDETVTSALHYVSYKNLSKTIGEFTYAPENTFAYAAEGEGAWFNKSTNTNYDYAGHDYKRTSTHILVKAQLLLGEEVNSIPESDNVSDKYCYENTYWSGAKKAELIKYMVAAVIGYGSFDLYTSATDQNDNTRFDVEEANKYFDLEKPANIEGGDGRVKLTLKKDNSAPKLYYAKKGNSNGVEVKDNDKDFERAIQVVGTAKHYNQGMMYYYIPIKHMAAIDGTTVDTDGKKVNYYKVGSYGVVRNHWYKVNVSSIKSPGVPVDDPNDPIIPNDDPDEGAYASFEIVIIPWHVITQDVPLE